MARPLCTRRGLAHSWAGCCPTSCAWMPPCTCSWSWPRCTRVCSMMSRPMSTTPKNAKRKWKQWCLASWSPTRSWLRCTRVCSVVSRPMTATRIAVSAPKESEWELTGQCWRNVTPVMKAWPTSCCMIFGMIKWCCTIDLPPSSQGGTRLRSKGICLGLGLEIWGWREKKMKFVCTRVLWSSFPILLIICCYSLIIIRYVVFSDLNGSGSCSPCALQE